MAVIKSLSLANFRIFDELTKFDFAPITILTGANNSGKSSLIKALLLLADNAKRNELNELDFSGNMHHLDNFQYVKNRNSKNDEISFSIEFSNYDSGEEFDYLSYRDRFAIEGYDKVEEENNLYPRNIEPYDFETKSDEGLILHLTYKQHGEIGELIKYSMSEDGIKFLEIEKNPIAKHKMYVNIRHLLRYKDTDFLFINAFEGSKEHALLLDKLIENYMCQFEFFKEEWEKDASPLQEYAFIKNKLRFETLNDIIQAFLHRCFSRFDSSKTFADILPREYLSTFSAILSKPLTEITSGIRFAKNGYAKEYLLRKFIESAKGLIANELSLGYIECFKANSQRIYSNQSQGTSFNELLLKISRITFDKDIQSFIIKWLKIFQIGEDFRLERLNGVATQVKIIRDGVELDLVDLGFGYTQILPLILQMAVYANDRIYGTILIEEPEANLHPKFQSKLIDLLLDASNCFGFHFVIETHSEYMIRRTQILVANNTKSMKEGSENIFSEGQPKIYYFYEPKYVPKGKNQIEEIAILPDGRLSKEFGEGFFDEATTLQIELLKLKNRIN